MFACDKCKTRVQNIDASHRLSDFICDLVGWDVMDRVGDPSVPESGDSGLAIRNSGGRRSAISHLERSVSNGRRGRAAVEQEPVGVSIPSVIRPGSAAPRATGRRSVASQRDAKGSARDCQSYW